VFDVELSYGAESDVLEAVCWDRDRFRKEYLGEFSYPIADIFRAGVLALDDPYNDVSRSFAVLMQGTVGSLEFQSSENQD